VKLLLDTHTFIWWDSAVEQEHVLALEGLPFHHRDPFDRLLVAQALVEDATLVSADPVLKLYPLEVRW